MAENSAEFSTLLDRTIDLRLAVNSELISLSGHLLATRIISLENESELRNTLLSTAERSAKLVELVQNKVRQNPRHYLTFIGILQGNQKHYQDILQNLKHTYLSHKEALSGRQSQHHEEADVLILINDLECQFRRLHGRILTELDDKQVTISSVLTALTLLPTAIRKEYKPSITEMFPDLRKEATVSELFYHLNPLMDFIGYGLLKYMIDQFGSDDLKKSMNSYSEEVVVFMKKTTVKQLMDHWSAEHEIPRNFSKLKAKLGEDSTRYTLYELEQLRKRYCSELKLTEIVFVIIGLEMTNSFIVEWLFPSVLIPYLMESAKEIDFAFFVHERILKVLVDEKQIFFFLPDSKPKFPALQAAAATVKDLKEDEQAVKRLSSSMEQFGLLSVEPPGVRRIREQLSDCALYSGVGIFVPLPLEMKVTLSRLNFKHIEVEFRFPSPGFKTTFSTIAQSTAYPGPPAAGSPPFVIAVFVSEMHYHTIFLHFLHLKQTQARADTVEEIIKPFLPQSAPHLVHIPKVFFISYYCSRQELHTQPPLFPDDPDANYCIAYHLKAYPDAYGMRVYPTATDSWMRLITDNLLAGQSVQETIQISRSSLDQEVECLHYFSSLKDSNLVLRK